MKRCPECQKFFIAEPQNRRYCTIECTKEADKKDAAKRVKVGRKKTREAKQRKKWKATEQRAFDMFYECIKQAIKDKVNQEMLANRKSLGRLMVRLREKWQEGASANDLWLGLTEDTKNIFRNFAERGVKIARRPRKARGA